MPLLHWMLFSSKLDYYNRLKRFTLRAGAGSSNRLDTMSRFCKICSLDTGLSKIENSDWTILFMEPPTLTRGKSEKLQAVGANKMLRLFVTPVALFYSWNLLEEVKMYLPTWWNGSLERIIRTAWKTTTTWFFHHSTFNIYVAQIASETTALNILSFNDVTVQFLFNVSFILRKRRLIEVD